MENNNEQGYEIELQYFKPSGKYYASGTYITYKQDMFHLVEEVEVMRKDRKLPGIGGNDWIIYINANKHPHGYPLLLLIK